MNIRTKNIVHVSVIVVVVAIVMVIARQGFAWTNPAGAPPFSSPSISTSGGSIGIGTASPGAKLDVNGDIRASGNRPVTINGGNGMVYSQGDAGGWSIGYHAKGSSGTDRGGFGFLGAGDAVTYYYIGSTYSSPTMVIQPSSGGVGIGTVSPDPNYKLTTIGGGVKADNSSASQPAGYFNNMGGGPALTVGMGGLTLGGVNQTSWPSGTWTTSGTNIYNANSGNVGIGTASPATKLDVSSGIISAQSSGVSIGSGNGYGCTGCGSNTTVTLYDPASGSVIFNTGYATSYYDFQKGGISKVRIDTNGNVGIGDTTPSYKLDVTGDINFTGTLRQNGVAVSSGIGGSGSANSIAKWTAGSALGNSLITDDGVTVTSAGQTDVTGGAGTVYNTAPIEVRTTATPRIAFHWPGVVASQLGMDSAGTIRTYDNPGTGFANFAAAGITANGNLSFGVANPTISASSYFTAPGGAYFNSGTVYTEAAIQARGGIHNDTAAYLTISGGTSANTYFSGNVGIGTNAPTAKLDLGTSGFAQAYSSGGSGWGGSTNTAGFRTAWSSGYGASFEAWDGGAPKWGIYKWNATTPAVVMQGQYDTLNVNFTGNVGIGTTAPVGKLDISTAVAGQKGIIINSDGTGVSVVSASSNGISATGGVNGVYGGGTTNGVSGFGNTSGVSGTGPIGVLAQGNGAGSTGVQATGDSYGVYSTGTNAGVSAGVYATGSYVGVFGRGNGGPVGSYGMGSSSGVTGAGTYGVIGYGSLAATGVGVYGYAAVGVQAYGNTSDFYATGPGIDYGTASSIRWKSNITGINNALDKILKLRGVYYDWDKEHGGKRDMGFIAEEIGAVVPEIVAWDKDAPGYATAVDYGHLTPVLVEAIKDQQKQIEELKKEIAEIKK